MAGPVNTYGFPITLSLISKNTFAGGIFNSLEWITINTSINGYSDGKFFYVPCLDVADGTTPFYVHWLIMKVRLSDLAIQLFMSYDNPFPINNGQFSFSLNCIPAGDQRFYFSPPAISGWANIDRALPFFVSTNQPFVANQIVRMNTTFITDVNVYPCIGAANSFGLGIISDGKRALEITSNEFGPCYTREFFLDDNLAQTVNHGVSDVRGNATNFIPSYFSMPINAALWGVGNLNENLIWLNGNNETNIQVTDQHTYTYTLNLGVIDIESLPSKCSSITDANVTVLKNSGITRISGNWPTTGKNISMFNPAPDLGLPGYTCVIGFYANQNALFISKNNHVVPFIVNDLDRPYYCAYTNAGLVVVGQGNVMLYNLPSLDLNINSYFPTPVTKIGVSLINMSRPVSPLGAFRT